MTSKAVSRFRRSTGRSATEIIVYVILFGIAWWVLTLIYDWMQDVKHERKYGPDGQVIEEVNPDAYSGPKGYQIRQ